MKLPKILIIDDQFGRIIQDRQNLCINFGLIDVTGDDPTPEEITMPVAEAVFCSSQKIEKSIIKNDYRIAIEKIKGGWPGIDGRRWASVLLDIRFVSGRVSERGGIEGEAGDSEYGLKILEQINKSYEELPVIILSSRERNEVIETARSKGAVDFIQRIGYSSDIPPKEILRQKLNEHALLEDARILDDERLRIVGNSLSIMNTMRAARRAATGKGNILILGETGTGKELLARYIHDVSPKYDGPYKVFHPFGVPETLQEDALFGHNKGAFNGATSDRQGLFEESNKGTIFIDEVGDIPESLQNKLLRPLESNVVTRLGGNSVIELDIQVVLATNKNLDEYVKSNKFKFDLLNRIKAYPIILPPLRDRKEDIPQIVVRLTELICKEHSARWPRKILPETMILLVEHIGDDNIRGLRNTLERAIKDNRDSEIIIPQDLKFDLPSSATDEISSKGSSVRVQLDDATDPISGLIERLSTFEFPKEYIKISGKLPLMQEAVARMMAKYLSAAIESTRKYKPGNNTDHDLNLTGAASCMMGKQLKTPMAADVIKKLLNMDKTARDHILKDNPVLKRAYDEVLRLRPMKPHRKGKGGG